MNKVNVSRFKLEDNGIEKDNLFLELDVDRLLLERIEELQTQLEEERILVWKLQRFIANRIKVK